MFFGPFSKHSFARVHFNLNFFVSAFVALQYSPNTTRLALNVFRLTFMFSIQFYPQQIKCSHLSFQSSNKYLSDSTHFNFAVHDTNNFINPSRGKSFGGVQRAQ